MGLDSVELVLAVEEEFGLSIPDRVAEKLYTVGSLHRFIVDELLRVGRPQESQAVFEKLQELICNQLAIGPEKVTADAHFVKDLGLN